MPTAVETTNQIQAKVLDSIQAGQQAVLDSVRRWSETVEVLSAKLPELAFAEPMKPSQVFESTVGFSEKVLASQRQFAARLFEAAQPATRAPSAATSTATQAAKGPGGKV